VPAPPESVAWAWVTKAALQAGPLPLVYRVLRWIDGHSDLFQRLGPALDRSRLLGERPNLRRKVSRRWTASPRGDARQCGLSSGRGAGIGLLPCRCVAGQAWGAGWAGPRCDRWGERRPAPAQAAFGSSTAMEGFRTEIRSPPMQPHRAPGLPPRHAARAARPEHPAPRRCALPTPAPTRPTPQAPPPMPRWT
jgi:hypothetical protein